MSTIGDPRWAGASEHEWEAALDAWWRAANYLSVGQIYLLVCP